jgi:hypothetical protein
MLSLGGAGKLATQADVILTQKNGQAKPDIESHGSCLMGGALLDHLVADPLVEALAGLAAQLALGNHVL